ncbi:MAG: FAD-binding oxidoreductase [Caulobacterales bacterium]
MTALLDALRQTLGPDHVSADPALRALMSQDIWARGGEAALVIAPGNAAECARAIAQATAAGHAVVPRGGGMSYTGGYVGESPGAVVLDLRRMNRVLVVRPEDRTVTVEAGCTWAQLDAALKPHGLRTPFWGPLSGISSTIGGGLSQHNAFFGAGLYGTTAESLVGLKVALADGSIIETGAGGYRFFGPDLAGLFLGDCGAFGVKLEATLRLIPRPAHEGWVSFSFADRDSACAAMAAIGREGLACELFGFDPNLARVRMKRASLMADAGALLKVVGAQKSLLSGLKEGAKIALAGRDFLDDADYSLHAVVEGRSAARVAEDLAEITLMAQSAGGRGVENTIPKVVRANPWTPLNNILGAEGERWAPVHGIIAMSRARDCWAAIDAVFDDRAARFGEHSVTTGCLTTTLSTNGFLIEPVFYWPDERFALHDATIEPGYLAKLARRDANPAALAVVQEARAAVIDVFAHFQAAHFQVGRAYPLLARAAPEMRAMLGALKKSLDPRGVMNPGALGLE